MSTNFDINISDIKHLPTLLHKTANALRTLIGGDVYRLYTVKNYETQIEFCPKAGERGANEEKAWRIQSNQTFCEHVATTKEYLLVNDVYNDARFPEHTGWAQEADITSVLCVPVMGTGENCCAVFEFAKTAGQFTQQNLDVLTIAIGWVGSSIEQYERRVSAQQNEELNMKLHRLQRDYFAQIATFEDVIDELLKLMKVAIGAENIVLYVLNNPVHSLLATEYVEGHYETPSRFLAKKLKSTLIGTALRAYKTCKPISIYSEMDSVRSSHAENRCSGRTNTSAMLPPMLFYPITSFDGKCQAIVQATNRVKGDFTATEETIIAKMFERWCSNIVLFKIQNDLTSFSMAANFIRNDCIMNRLKIRYIKDPLVRPLDPKIDAYPGITSFMWYPTNMDNEALVNVAYHLIQDVCGGPLLHDDNIYMFAIIIMKMHHDLPNHNFEHSFVCMHTVYCILKRYSDRFDYIEKMAMMLGALCRNIEHVGCSNALLRFAKLPLAIVHDNACMQNHQFWLASLMIKNTEVDTLFDDEQKARFMKQFQMFMIQSEIQSHLRYSRPKLEEVCANDEKSSRCNFNWMDETQRTLLRGLISTAASLAMYTKPYRVASKLCLRQMAELFAEGDEVRKFGLTPVPVMNRAFYVLVPEWHLKLVRFLQPCFLLLQNVLPETAELNDGADMLCKAWQEVIDARGQRVWSQDMSHAD